VRPQHEFTPRSWRQLCPPLPDPDTAVANDCRMPRKGGKEFQLERAELLRLRPRQWLSDPVVNLYTECPRARARPSSCSLPPLLPASCLRASLSRRAAVLTAPPGCAAVVLVHQYCSAVRMC
jgi:hypothetical protein